VAVELAVVVAVHVLKDAVAAAVVDAVRCTIDGACGACMVATLTTGSVQQLVGSGSIDPAALSLPYGWL